MPCECKRECEDYCGNCCTDPEKYQSGCFKSNDKAPERPGPSGSNESPSSITGRVFTVGDLWGPFPCEAEGCTEIECYSIFLTDDENNRLPVDHGPKAVVYIFDNKLGTALCDKCLKAARQ
ncbi:MAG: hypothetical protein KAV87_00275 [Desulfobacteraceae bacterium]|nr:hypothetical protein [Desulfobacteraceae bacterium]